MGSEVTAEVHEIDDEGERARGPVPHSLCEALTHDPVFRGPEHEELSSLYSMDWAQPPHERVLREHEHGDLHSLYELD